MDQQQPLSQTQAQNIPNNQKHNIGYDTIRQFQMVSPPENPPTTTNSKPQPNHFYLQINQDSNTLNNSQASHFGIPSGEQSKTMTKQMQFDQNFSEFSNSKLYSTMQTHNPKQGQSTQQANYQQPSEKNINDQSNKENNNNPEDDDHSYQRLMTDEGLANALHKLGIPIQMKKGGSYEYSSLNQLPVSALKQNNNHDSHRISDSSSHRAGCLDYSAKRSQAGSGPNSASNSMYGGVNSSKSAQKLKKEMANKEQNELIRQITENLKFVTKCKIHNQSFSLFNPLNKQLCCIECLYNNPKMQHKKLQVLSLKSAWPVILETNKIYKKEAKEKVNILDEGIRSCILNANTVQNSHENLISHVRKEFSDLYEDLKKRELFLLESVSSIMQGEMNKLKTRIEEMEYLKGCFRDAKEVEPSQSFELGVHFYGVYNLLKGVMKNFEIQSPLLNPEELSLIEFGTRNIIKNDISQFGRIHNRGNSKEKRAQQPKSNRLNSNRSGELTSSKSHSKLTTVNNNVNNTTRQPRKLATTTPPSQKKQPQSKIKSGSHTPERSNSREGSRFSTNKNPLAAHNNPNSHSPHERQYRTPPQTSSAERNVIKKATKMTTSMSTGKIGSPGVDMLTYPRAQQQKKSIPDLFNSHDENTSPFNKDLPGGATQTVQATDRILKSADKKRSSSKENKNQNILNINNQVLNNANNQVLASNNQLLNHNNMVLNSNNDGVLNSNNNVNNNGNIFNGNGSNNNNNANNNNPNAASSNSKKDLLREIYASMNLNREQILENVKRTDPTNKTNNVSSAKTININNLNPNQLTGNLSQQHQQLNHQIQHLNHHPSHQPKKSVSSVSSINPESSSGQSSFNLNQFNVSATTASMFKPQSYGECMLRTPHMEPNLNIISEENSKQIEDKSTSKLLSVNAAKSSCQENSTNIAQQQQQDIAAGTHAGATKSIEFINNLFLFQDSTILSNDIKDSEFYNLLPTNIKHTKRLYSLSKDGQGSQKFHDLCDHNSPIMLVIRANQDFVFGYYSSIGFQKDEKYNTCDDCFLFSLKNPLYNNKVIKYPIKPDKKFIAVYQSSKSPCFGSTLSNKQDLWIQFDDLKNSCSRIGYAYQLPEGVQPSEALAGKYTNWDIQEIEAYKIFLS